MHGARLVMAVYTGELLLESDNHLQVSAFLVYTYRHVW